MSSSNYDNDELIFLDEDNSNDNEEYSRAGWKTLVVDDDQEIHSVTRLALSDLALHGRRLEFLHANSGEEAMQVLREHGNSIAIILLDVVMETDDAGLVVAKRLREELKLDEPRIILRTGQPGYAPEENVVKEYDINDYKTKTELTRSKLVTTVISSLRSYKQIQTINQSRQGLSKIISSAAHLLEEQSVKGFCEGVVTQISSLLGLDAGGVVCARAGSVLDKDDEGVFVLGAAGEFAPYINKKIESIHNSKIISAVEECLRKKQHLYYSGYSVLYMNSSGYEAAVYLQLDEEISAVHKQLIEVFLSSVSIGYENVNLFHQLRNAAFKDPLTRLPNRNEFINMLDHLTNADSEVVALLDISHFSDVNDGLGQDVGNNLLVAVARHLTQSFPESVKLARIGADVFGLIGSEQHVEPKLISQLFVNPVETLDQSLPVNINIGLCRDLDESGLNLLKRANIALNLAKKTLHNNFEYYQSHMEDKTTQQLDLIRSLRADFAERKLQVWYQPQVDLITEQVVGMEALLRWPDDKGGYISPAVFVPLAEYSGLIVDIGAWVMEESCRQLAQLKQLCNRDLRVAINISMPQFRDANFIDVVKSAVLGNNLNPDLIELEITESVVMDEPQIVVESLQALKAFGVNIAIDDFGTGFSSMNYLQKLPLDRLKVDRSFVNEVAPGKSAFIAETIVTLGKRLGLQTIAEGVEKREQASFMLKLGCDEAQGYLYAKPMPFEALVAFLTKD